MTTELANLNTEFGAGSDLATMLGFGSTGGNVQINRLPELSQLYKAAKGQVEVKGKLMTMETIPGGYYCYTDAEGNKTYSETVTIRPFMQRFQYQRFEKFAAPVDGKSGRMFRSVMSIGFNTGDLKDNYGTFNCGRPGGYIKDYDTLSSALRDVVKNTKRIMLVFGLVTLDKPTDENGNDVEFPANVPFLYRVKNSHSYKALENAFKAIIKIPHLPIQYLVTLSHAGEKLPNNEMNYFVVAKLDNYEEMTDEDKKTLRDFLDWVEKTNRMILGLWDAAHRNDVSDSDRDLVNQFINIGGDDITHSEEEVA
jgi:hypothetical protein